MVLDAMVEHLENGEYILGQKQEDHQKYLKSSFHVLYIVLRSRSQTVNKIGKIFFLIEFRVY